MAPAASGTRSPPTPHSSLRSNCCKSIEKRAGMRTTRIGLGPVFAYEWLTASRRWQLYAGRVLFVLALFVALALVWLQQVGLESYVGQRLVAKVGENFFYALMGTQLAVVLLAAP